MGRRTLVTAGVLLVVGALMAASPSLAKSSRTPVDFYEVSCLVDPGIQWVGGKNDRKLHVRGQVSLSTVYDTLTLAPIGMNLVVSNLDINTETGKGTSHGTFSSSFLPDLAGGFDGTWNGRLKPLPQFLGQAVGKGTGSLTGQKVKLTLRSETDFVPAELPCAPDLIVGIYRNTGFVRDPDGD